MRTFPFVAAVASFVSATAFASVLVFDDSAVFDAGLVETSLAKFNQTFESYAGSSSTFTGGTGSYAWTASSPNGVYAQTGVVRTMTATDSLLFSFSTNQVFGVGGLFHYVDGNGAYKSGLMKIKLSDGTTFIRSISSQTTFSGFITTGASISSVELSHLGSVATTFSAAESLVIGYVPAPSAFALIGLAGITIRRRRA